MYYTPSRIPTETTRKYATLLTLTSCIIRVRDTRARRNTYRSITIFNYIFRSIKTIVYWKKMFMLIVELFLNDSTGTKISLFVTVLNSILRVCIKICVSWTRLFQISITKFRLFVEACSEGWKTNRPVLIDIREYSQHSTSRIFVCVR